MNGGSTPEDKAESTASQAWEKAGIMRAVTVKLTVGLWPCCQQPRKKHMSEHCECMSDNSEFYVLLFHTFVCVFLLQPEIIINVSFLSQIGLLNIKVQVQV